MKAPWPKYTCRKIVQATPIVWIGEILANMLVNVKLPAVILVEPYGDGVWEAFLPTEPAMIEHAEVGAYAVVYDDGYRSVSPKAAFEAGYDLIAPPEPAPPAPPVEPYPDALAEGDPVPGIEPIPSNLVEAAAVPVPADT